MNVKQLYFIALLPSQNLSEKIKTIKEDFAKEYHCSHALKLQPHITIQPPFKRDATFEDEMDTALRKFFSSFTSFEIRLEGYGCFNRKTNKVIFIKVKENKPLLDLQLQLKNYLKTSLEFSDSELPPEFHPHITIAHRDLSTENFRKAWPVYEKKIFEENFKVTSAFLFRHTSQKWEVRQEFTF